ncbi:transmembrane protein 187, partial [Chelydra serpentina]
GRNGSANGCTALAQRGGAVPWGVEAAGGARPGHGPEDRTALLHVSGAGTLCLAVLAAGPLDSVAVEVGYGHYAEPPVPWLPLALAMPCNSLVNLGYMALGWRWFPRAGHRPSRYLQATFALLALAYGPVQWARLWTQQPRAAVLDQWVTLPIFAWAGLWRHCLARGWQAGRAAQAVGASLLSHGLAPAHARGFEPALAAHVAGVAAPGGRGLGLDGARRLRRLPGLRAAEAGRRRAGPVGPVPETQRPRLVPGVRRAAIALRLGRAPPAQ